MRPKQTEGDPHGCQNCKVSVHLLIPDCAVPDSASEAQHANVHERTGRSERESMTYLGYYIVQLIMESST